MPDTYLRKLLNGRPEFAARADKLLARCQSERLTGETLVEVLARVGIFLPTAPRTMDLMRKGFLAPDVSLLFVSDGLARLSSYLTETVRSESEVHTPSPATRTDRLPAVALIRSPRVETLPEVRLDSRTTAELPTNNGLPTVGATLGRCLITAVLGKGGHGVVYAALHQSLNIPVAVKVLVSEHGPDPSIRTKLRHEARALARLNHSNIIRVLDFDDGEPPYVVMEYVEGPSLADLITQTGGIRVDRARDIFVQVCRGLEAAWGEGIVHRDIKPGNILLTRNGTAKLADLGLALTDRDQNSPPAAGGSPVGTCAYMAPEQARMANAVDFKADIYALGVTFYHAVTGQHPFPAKNAREALLKHATMAAVPPHEVAPQLVDAATSAVIMRMMAKTPEERHHSYEELIYELTVCGQASPVGETPRSATSTPPSSVGVPRQSGLFRWFRTQRETRTTGDSQGR